MKIGLVQINNSFSGANYLPYSVGILQAYAQKYLQNPRDYEFCLPIYKRIPVEVAVKRLIDADVVAFSVYVWNFRISSVIAQALKGKRPDIITVFGGPHVPDRAETFLREHPFIDIACHKEGEQAFVAILENCFNADWSTIPSISYIRDGAFYQNPLISRLKDLSLIPPPYLTGVFDRLMVENRHEQWLVMWETNRGCPFFCTFCDWGSLIASKVYKFDMERLYGELEWCAKNKIEFIFCADANFGIFPRDVEIARYAASVKQKHGYPKALSVQNAKNAEDRIFEAQYILAKAGLNKGVTLAFQSRDPQTLKDIKRDNISSTDFQRLQRRFTEAGIETYSDMILGLPGETYDSFANGVSQTIKDGQHNRIQFGNLSLLPNAEMGDPAYQEKYGMMKVETRAVIYHGVIDESPDQIHETELLVVATNTMSREDWVRTRAFCWMTALLHFDKIFQIPLVVVNETCGVSYRDLIEIFSEWADDEFPTIVGIREFFREKARSIQQGREEFCPSKEWLNIWWPADEYVFIKLVTENRLNSFYQEAEGSILKFLASKSISITPGLLHEAIELNRRLIKLPFQTEDLEISLSFNIWEFYQSILKGKPVELERTPTSYWIDRTSTRWSSWEDWYREVVWFGNKKGAYLYSQRAVERELEGHY